MKPILFRGANIWDGSGAPTFPGDVLVDGSRIKSIARAPDRLAVDGATVIEARGRTLMPGLVDTHVHVNEPGRTEWEGFATATRALENLAAAGMRDSKISVVVTRENAGQLDDFAALADRYGATLRLTDPTVSRFHGERRARRDRGTAASRSLMDMLLATPSRRVSQ